MGAQTMNPLGVAAAGRLPANSAPTLKSQSSTELADGSTLYVGNLHPCVSVAALQEICAYFGPVEQVKVIKDKATGHSAGYGFVKFVDRSCADLALQYLQGKVFYGQELRVNWAFQSHQREDTSNHFHIFVGDLGQEVTDAVLFNAFSMATGCSDARVMWDHATGRSKGYGFVSFRSREEAQTAIENMHGQVIGSRRVRCGWAQHKQEDASRSADYASIDHADPLNTNVYVGNIAPEWSEQDFNQHFAAYGPIAEVKLHKKCSYGFVRYERHEDAVRAIIDNQAKMVHGRLIKCSWGKNSNTPPGQSGPASIAPLMMAGMQRMGGQGMQPMGGQGMLMGGQAMLPGMLGSSVMMQGGMSGAGAGLMQGQYMGANQMLSVPQQALTPSQVLLMAGQQDLSLDARMQQGSFQPDAQAVFYQNGLYYGR